MLSSTSLKSTKFPYVSQYYSDLFSLDNSEVGGNLALVSFLSLIISGWGMMVHV